MARYRTVQEALDHAYYLNWLGQHRRARGLMQGIIDHVVKEVPSEQAQKQTNSTEQKKGAPRG